MKTGQASQLWIDVLESFKDDSFNIMPNICAGYPQFQDRACNPLDISKCLLPWAMTETLYKWLNTTNNAVSSYWKGFGKSNGHNFNLEGIGGPGFEFFCSKFCNSMKNMMYIMTWVIITRGDLSSSPH
jgi:hypothetical protein